MLCCSKILKILLFFVNLNLITWYLCEKIFYVNINQEILDKFIFELENNKYKNKIQILKLEHCTDDYSDYIYLVCIKVKKMQQRLGYGNAIMYDIIKLVDEYNVRIKL